MNASNATHPAALRPLFSADFDAAAEELASLRALDALSDVVDAALAPVRAEHGHLATTCKTTPDGEPWILVSCFGAFDPRAAYFAALSALEGAGIEAARGVDRWTLSAALPAARALAA